MIGHTLTSGQAGGYAVSAGISFSQTPQAGQGAVHAKARQTQHGDTMTITTETEKFPAYKIVSTANLVPYARNSRTHSDAQVAKIAASIREFGFLNPVIIDGSNGIIAGHGRVMAAQKLGIANLPVIEAAHLSEAQRRAYVITDNRTALDAGWDNDLLKIELQDLDAQGFDLTLTGFEIGEMAAMFDDPVAPESSTQEIDPDDYEMECTCPKCGFEFDPKT